LASPSIAKRQKASPAAPTPTPICIGPAAPAELTPSVTPGARRRPWLLSTLPIPARTGHGSPGQASAAVWYSDRYAGGMSLRASLVGWLPPRMPVEIPPTMSIVNISSTSGAATAAMTTFFMCCPTP
jgi:hypothetical protein